MRWSENSIPNNQPHTQPGRAPKHHLRRTLALVCALEFFVSLADILGRGGCISDKLRDEFFLSRQVRDEGLLEGGDFEEGFFCVPMQLINIYMYVCI